MRERQRPRWRRATPQKWQSAGSSIDPPSGRHGPSPVIGYAVKHRLAYRRQPVKANVLLTRGASEDLPHLIWDGIPSSAIVQQFMRRRPDSSPQQCPRLAHETSRQPVRPSSVRSLVRPARATGSAQAGYAEAASPVSQLIKDFGPPVRAQPWSGSARPCRSLISSVTCGIFAITMAERQLRAYPRLAGGCSITARWTSSPTGGRTTNLRQVRALCCWAVAMATGAGRRPVGVRPAG